MAPRPAYTRIVCVVAIYSTPLFDLRLRPRLADAERPVGAALYASRADVSVAVTVPPKISPAWRRRNTERPRAHVQDVEGQVRASTSYGSERGIAATA